MAVGGDPHEIRDEARRLRRLADQARDQANTVRRGQSVTWHGLAADRFRDRLVGHARDIDAVEAALLEAATRLDRLADTLEERQSAISRAMNWVSDTLNDARRTINLLAGQAADALTDAERAIQERAHDLIAAAGTLPRPGDPGWLDLAQRLGR